MNYKLTDFSLNYAFKSVPDSPLPKYLLPRLSCYEEGIAGGGGAVTPPMCLLFIFCTVSTQQYG